MHVKLGLMAKMSGWSQVVILPWKMAAATVPLSRKELGVVKLVRLA